MNQLFPHDMKAVDETSRCLLCQDAPCTSACRKGMDPARGIRALNFMNIHNAGVWINRENCADCSADCEKACIHYDYPIRIKELAKDIDKRDSIANRDLSIEFCGIKAENPFFVGSAVTASSYEMLAKAFRMGWAGAFYKTISFIPIEEVSPRFDMTEKGGTKFTGFRNMEQLSENDIATDLEIMSRLKKDFPSKILVASIMGQNDEEWVRIAQMVQDAGVDMIECNFSCPHMKAKGVGSDIGQDPDMCRHLAGLVKQAVHIPVLAKMTPNITHIAEPAIASVQGGADGIVAINTIKSVTMNYRSQICDQATISGYSGKAVKPIGQRMILEMAKDPQLQGIPLCGVGGIENWRDAQEYILLGCGIVQVVTAIMQYGYRIIDDLLSGASDFLDRHHATSLEEIRGDALKRFVSTDQLDRSTYVLPKIDRSKCVGCGRCFISCYDGGHQAISFEDRKPHIIGTRCVGCHLCLLVCPTDAISTANRIPKKKK